MRIAAPCLLALATALSGCVAADGADHEHADFAALQSRVRAAEEAITTQATTIEELQAELAAVTGGVDVTDLAASVDDHESRIATLETDSATHAEVADGDAALATRIDDHGVLIADNGIAAAVNADGVAQNAADIAQLVTDVAAGAVILSANSTAIGLNSADIGANATAISSNSGLISSSSTAIATNTAAIAQNASDIASNAGDIAANAADIGANTGAATQNAVDIAANAADIAAMLGDIGTNTASAAQNAADITTNALAGAANATAIGVLQGQTLAGTVNSPAASCLALLTASPGLPDGPYWLLGDTGVPYQAWCDMTTNNGGWTLLGTVFGGDRNMWNVEEKLWANDVTFGSADSPFADHKSAAWYDLDLSSAEILFERRYDGVTLAQTVIGNACLTDSGTGSAATYFNDLFVDWTDFQTPCANANLTVITPANDATGLSGASYQEGSGSDAIGGSGANGFCWNGGDTNSNTFQGHIGWNQSSYATSCYAPGHLGYVGVFSNGSSQYSNRDIDTTNWLHSTDVTRTGISLYAR